MGSTSGDDGSIYSSDVQEGNMGVLTLPQSLELITHGPCEE